jgi:hypothetical protein
MKIFLILLLQTQKYVTYNNIEHGNTERIQKTETQPEMAKEAGSAHLPQACYLCPLSVL